MRVLRMLFLGVATMIAAMALAAGASAQEVEVYDEEPTVNHHCGTVVENDAHEADGGCQITAHTVENAILRQHTGTSEVVISNCENEFEAAVGEDGSGYIFHQELLPIGPPCNIQPCDEVDGEPRPWPFSISEAGPNTAEHETLNVSFCTRPFNLPAGTPGTTCNVNVGLEEVDHHEYELVADESPCINLGGVVELSGAWEIEEPIEIYHHDDD